MIMLRNSITSGSFDHTAWHVGRDWVWLEIFLISCRQAQAAKL